MGLSRWTGTTQSYRQCPLDGETDDRIPGYELENCDRIDQTGAGQVVSWNGNAGLDNVDCTSMRIRIVFVGRGDSVRLYGVGIRRAPQ